MNQAPISVITSCKLELVLQPVPMPIMPSSNSDAWLAFIARGQSSYSFPLDLPEVERVQEYMIEHSTECLTDGNRNYTIAGRNLVACYPDQIPRELVRKYELA